MSPTSELVNLDRFVRITKNLNTIQVLDCFCANLLVLVQIQRLNWILVWCPFHEQNERGLATKI